MPAFRKAFRQHCLSAWSNDSPCKCPSSCWPRTFSTPLYLLSKSVWYVELKHYKGLLWLSLNTELSSNLKREKFSCRIFLASLFCRKWPIAVFPTGKQETNTACSPRGQVEVSVDCHASTQLPLHPSLLLLLLLPHSCDKESQFGCQGNRLFPWWCWNTWEGQGGFVSPCDEGFSPCMFNRQTYGPKPNSRAHLPQPDYVQWSFWHRHFASFITLRSSHRGHLSYCCTVFLMSTAETTDSQTKQGKHTCVSLAVTDIRLAK